LNFVKSKSIRSAKKVKKWVAAVRKFNHTRCAKTATLVVSASKSQDITTPPPKQDDPHADQPTGVPYSVSTDDQPQGQGYGGGR
jgi:hypothetical protein